ncbi:MAG: biotin/lipoyl-binding protein [candidate division Zixibacteria bacterium]|nr:biotin/lipoyl-binding protein [candidate division Zixibacteria bacterium]MDH3936682.1 biotin/lipoyl-binding protein [candidate division Zixibacteria bacterium]MDH4034623.1 biotin/lipoyl-binding protein [candidate division Zixibacteria bacterium]
MPRYLVKVEGHEYDVEVQYRADGYAVTVDGSPVRISTHELNDTRSVLLVDDRSFEVDVRSNGHDESRVVFMLGVEIAAEVEQYHLAQLRKRAGIATEASAQKVLRAPMPGLILEVKIAEGAAVAKDDPLIVIEAMKMENVLKAPADGTVKTVSVTKGASVEKGDVLMEFE